MVTFLLLLQFLLLSEFLDPAPITLVTCHLAHVFPVLVVITFLLSNLR